MNGDLQEIRRLVKRYVDAREARDAIADTISDEHRTVVKRNLRGLRDAVARVSSAEDALRQAIEAGRHLFERPRTRAIDGVKVGYRKAKGKIEVADAENTVRLIRRKLPDLADTLIVTSERVDKQALGKLPAKDLAKIGVTLEDDTDQVVLALAETDTDRLVSILMEQYRDEVPS